MTVVLLFQSFEDSGVEQPNFFSPPIRGFTGPWRRETLEEEKHFLGRFRGEARAVNVYKLLTGIYTEDEGIDPLLIDIIYRGSTTVEVSDAEAALLTAAGYTVS